MRKQDAVEQQVLAAYGDGQPVEEICAAYGVSPAQVDQIATAHLEATSRPPVPGPRLGWRHSHGNRAVLGGVVGFALQAVIGGPGLFRVAVWLLVGLIGYAVTAPRRA